jgi:decaprenylphospho-beta-D-erythro-pentofuranosid-2-ulose 2-reductase
VNDATGMPQRAVVVGGTSEIALAVLDLLAARRLEQVLLASRDTEGLAAAAERVRRAGAREVATVRCDVTVAADVAALVREATERLGSVDLVLVAAGDLGTADLAELGPDRVLAMMAANAGGPAAAMIAFARVMAAQGWGRIVVLSSVAGLRVRRANLVYGAGKAALDGLALALGDAVAGDGVSVTVVRPGFVRTRMTAGLAPAPLATDAPAVAAAVVAAMERGDDVVYVPPALRYLFGMLRVLPRSVFRRLSS